MEQKEKGPGVAYILMMRAKRNGNCAVAAAGSAPGRNPQFRDQTYA
jgi:hypothetical protein